VKRRALALAGHAGEGTVRVLDAAYWRKGCSSLGKLRYAVVLGVRGEKDGAEYLALVDIKEAVPSVAPAAAGVAMPADPAERVVAGACALAPNLGERMIPAQVLGKPVVLRELAPQDLKIEVDSSRAARPWLPHPISPTSSAWPMPGRWMTKRARNGGAGWCQRRPMPRRPPGCGAAWWTSPRGTRPAISTIAAGWRDRGAASVLLAGDGAGHLVGALHRQRHSPFPGRPSR
jgi:hypothetical protein